MRRALRDLTLAIGFLTLVPVGRKWPEDSAPDAVGMYPVAGWVLGLVGAGVAWVFAWATQGSLFGPLSAGIAIVAVWALMTRFLHWDGLADTADGLWGAFEPSRRLEIMRDSRIGSFGTVAVVLVALGQVVACAMLVEYSAWWVLVAAPVLGRAAASASAWSIAPARVDGLGLTVCERPSVRAIGYWMCAVGSIAVVGSVFESSVPVLLGVFIVAVFTGWSMPRMLARGVGGMTGDLFGATVLVVETSVLIAGAVVR